MIRTIIFDYFDVLAHDSYWHTVVEKAKITNHLNAMREAQSGLNLGQLSWPQFCNNIGKIMEVPSELVASGYDTILINQAVVEYILLLKKDYQIALLSNAGKEQLLPQLKEKGVIDLFQKIGVSSDYGIIKPNPKLFTQFVSDLGNIPEECVMIDDNTENVIGAIAAGLRAIHFKNIQQLKAELGAMLHD